jgi:hypothetical protein
MAKQADEDLFISSMTVDAGVDPFVPGGGSNAIASQEIIAAVEAVHPSERVKHSRTNPRSSLFSKQVHFEPSSKRLVKPNVSKGRPRKLRRVSGRIRRQREIRAGRG